MDLTHKPRIINAKYLKDVLGGEASFTVTGSEKVTTRDDKEIECLTLTGLDGETIFYNPNATARKQFSEKGLKTSEDAEGYILDFHIKQTMMGGEEVDAIRIKEIREPIEKMAGYTL